MKISTYVRHMREASKNVVRNGWMTFASVSSIAISLFILGLFLILSLNVQHLSEQIEKQVEIRVFLELETPEEAIAELERDIRALPGVSQVRFVSKDEGLEWLRERMGERGEQLLQGLEGENNPLNDAFTVEVSEPRQVPETAAAIEALNEGKTPPPIYEVKYGQGTVESLFKATRIINNIGLVLVACLGLTAMFLISNTIKLTIMARNREIKIMKLVGATNSFIRWPFFLEGMILGLIGAMLPTAVLAYGYYALTNSSHVDLSLFMLELKPFEDTIYPLAGLLVGIGVVIGIWGSTISVRKYLKV